MITKPLSVAEVAEQTGIAEGTFRYWAHVGKGPRSFKLGRRRVYDVADVETWLAEQRAAGERSR